MTERKIKFTKINTKIIPANKLKPGSKGLEMEIQETDFALKSMGKETTWKIGKIFFAFETNQELYDNLLNNKSFELTVDESEMCVHPKGVHGGGLITCVEVWQESEGIDGGTIEVTFNSKSTDKVKLTTEKDKPAPHPKNFTDLENEVNTALKSGKIAEIGKMKSEVQNFLTTNSEKKDETQILLTKLEQKEQELKENNPSNPEKFPWKIVVPITLSLIVALGLVIFFTRKKEKK